MGKLVRRTRRHAGLAARGHRHIDRPGFGVAVAVMLVVPVTTTLVPGFEPKFTVELGAKAEPVIVIWVPPVAGGRTPG